LVISVFYVFSAYPQTNINDSTITIPYDTFKIKYDRFISKSSDSILTHNYLWNDKKDLSEILFERNGFFTGFHNEGGRTTINYKGLSESQIGFFKDGVQQNDIFFGGYDIENISVNEIEKIEEVSDVLSFMYGFNSRKKAINIISKNQFLPYIFTQLRYSQDRYDALYADAYFNIPFSKKLNIILGTGNHASEGRYKNSDFSLWRTRVKINYYYSPLLNIRFDFNYSKHQRGLNEGLELSTDDTLSNEILANVINTDSYDKTTNLFFNFNITSAILKNNNITQVNVYALNTLREYRDEENRTNPNGTYVKNNFHYIRYGLDLKQILKLNISKNIAADFIFGGNGYYDLYNYNPLNLIYNGIYDDGSLSLSENFIHYSVYSRFDLILGNLYASGGIRNDVFEGTPYLQYGAEGGYKFSYMSYAIILFGGFNSTVEGFNFNKLKYPFNEAGEYFSGNAGGYLEGGIKINISGFKFKFKFYAQDYSGNFDFKNGNFSAEYFSDRIEGKLLVDKFNYNNYPEFFIKTDICYHNYFFDNHLNLKAGFNIKYSSSYIPILYSQYKLEQIPNSDIRFDRTFFNIDAYIGARIGSANLTFILANLFDNLNYTTSLFPYNERGGFANVLARFSITWDFKY